MEDEKRGVGRPKKYKDPTEAYKAIYERRKNKTKELEQRISELEKELSQLKTKYSKEKTRNKILSKTCEEQEQTISEFMVYLPQLEELAKIEPQIQDIKI